MPRAPSTTGIAMTLAAAVLWGTSFPANQVGLRTLSPGTFAAARFALAAIVVLPFAWRTIRSTVRRWEPWALGALNAVAFYMQYWGQVTAPAGASGLLVNANVGVVALVAWAWLGERPQRRTWVAMGVALVGASLIVYEPGTGGVQWGHVVVFLSGTLFSLYIVGARAAVLEGFTPTSLALATFVATGVLLGPFLVLQPLVLDGQALSMVAYTGIACTVIAYLLYIHGLRSIGATASAVVLLLEIFVAALLGWWLLDEAFGVRKLAGGGAIVLAIWLLSQRGGQPVIQDAAT